MLSFLACSQTVPEGDASPGGLHDLQRPKDPEQIQGRNPHLQRRHPGERRYHPLIAPNETPPEVSLRAPHLAMDLRGENPLPTWCNSITHLGKESEEFSIEPHSAASSCTAAAVGRESSA
jgi:hypothetical protein